MVDDNRLEVRSTSYSLIDVVSASGGLLTGAYYLFIPLANLPSRLNFDLGVISLLFLARTAKNKQSLYHGQKFAEKMPREWKHTRV